MRLLASMLALAVGVFYLWLIGTQDEAVTSRVWFVFGCLVAAALLVLVPRALPGVLAATLLVAWAFLGALSIGILVAPSAVVALVAVSRSLQLLPARHATTIAIAGSAAGVATVAAGLLLTA